MNKQVRLKTVFLALTAAAALAVSAPLMARSGGHGGDRVEHMAERLELSEGQKEAVQDLFDAHRETMTDVEWRTADGERNPEARAQAVEARKALHEEIRALLTEEQAEKFDAMQERKRRHHRRRGRDHRGEE